MVGKVMVLQSVVETCILNLLFNLNMHSSIINSHSLGEPMFVMVMRHSHGLLEAPCHMSHTKRNAPSTSPYCMVD